MPLKNRTVGMQPEIAGWRHYLHSYPELRFDLPETTSKVLSLLKKFGVD